MKLKPEISDPCVESRKIYGNVLIAPVAGTNTKTMLFEVNHWPLVVPSLAVPSSQALRSNWPIAIEPVVHLELLPVIHRGSR
jgi:hypothetical protein